MKGRYRYRNKKNRGGTFHNHSTQSAILRSGYTVDQTWKGLKKAWLGYTIAKNKEEDDRMVYYAELSQKLRNELGLPQGNFSNIDMDEAIQNEISNRKKNSENDNNHKEKSRVH
jgi:hypothetical protein